jgi:hypothetical protein
VTRGVQKHEKKLFCEKIHLAWAHHKKCVFFSLLFLPSVVLVDIFLSRFWVFRNKGSSKTRLKKSRENLLGFQKKYFTLCLLLLHSPSGTLFDKTGALPRQMHFPFPQRVEVPHGNGNTTKRLATDMKARATTLNPSQQEQRECALQASLAAHEGTDGAGNSEA